MYVQTIIFRSKKDFKFGTLSVREGDTWTEIWGKLKKTGKTTCFQRTNYLKGKGKTYQVHPEEKDNPAWIPFEQL